MKDMSSIYESALRALLSDPRYRNNLEWGEPRAGHPEGSIRAHIEELERNLEVLQPKLYGEDVWKLKLLIHTHDTFKPQSVPNIRITDPASHASLAKAFLAEFCADDDLLAMVQFHDEPYALWQQVKSRGSFHRGRFAKLLETIKDWNLFSAFLIIDGCTAGKGRQPLRWLFKELNGKVQTSFSEADMMG